MEDATDNLVINLGGSVDTSDSVNKADDNSDRDNDSEGYYKDTIMENFPLFKTNGKFSAICCYCLL